MMDDQHKYTSGSQSSMDALHSVMPKINQIERQVWRHLLSQGDHGATPIETSHALNGHIPTISTRFAPLYDKGLIRPNGEKRNTYSTVDCPVYVANAHPIPNSPRSRKGAAARTPMPDVISIEQIRAIRTSIQKHDLFAALSLCNALIGDN